MWSHRGAPLVASARTSSFHEMIFSGTGMKRALRRFSSASSRAGCRGISSSSSSSSSGSTRITSRSNGRSNVWLACKSRHAVRHRLKLPLRVLTRGVATMPQTNDAETRIDQYKLCFRMCDRNGTGTVSMRELSQLMQELGLSATETEILELASFGDDGGGQGSDELKFNDFVSFIETVKERAVAVDEKEQDDGVIGDPSSSPEEVADLVPRWLLLGRDSRAYLNTHYSQFRSTLAQYKRGFSLLGSQLKLAWSLIAAGMVGRQLTASERRRIFNANLDLLKLIPFAAMLLMPAGSLVAPIVGKVFPSMLPSTFIAQPRNVRQDMVAHEVNATIQQMISTLKDDRSVLLTAHAMYDEMVDFSSLGTPSSISFALRDHLQPVASMDPDGDILLDRLEKMELKIICRGLKLAAPPRAPPFFLRHMIGKRVKGVEKRLEKVSSDEVVPPDILKLCGLEESLEIKFEPLGEDTFRQELLVVLLESQGAKVMNKNFK